MNEDRKQEYVIQYQTKSGPWHDGHRFWTDTDAFEFAKDRRRLVFPELPHRIVERITTQAVLLNIEPIEEADHDA